jgi:Ankyrin repeat
MTFSLMPREMKGLIVNCINPSKITSEEVKQCARTIANLSLINQELKRICQEKLKDLKKIYELANKYNRYNNDVKKTIIILRLSQSSRRTIQESREEIIPGGNGQLYDALLSGYHPIFNLSSFNRYNAKIEKDIKRIIKLIPQSINFSSGVAWGRDHLTPLYVACVNGNIPPSIIKFLLKSGANPKSDITLFNGVNCFNVKIIEDLKSTITPERYKIILALFKKYGVEPCELFNHCL